MENENIQIVEFGEFSNKALLLDFIKNSQWEAGIKLYDFITSGSIHEKLGKDAKIYFMMIDEKPTAYITFSKYDCLDDKDLFPWVGFVYTDPEFRGIRLSQKLIDHSLTEAKAQGYNKAYLATGHIGFYEKYGFEYIGQAMDIYDRECRLYIINL